MAKKKKETVEEMERTIGELRDLLKVPQWLKLAQIYDADNLRNYEVGEELSNNGIALVSRGTGGYVYKRSIPFLIENELYCLQKLYFDCGFAKYYYTPYATRFDKYTIQMEDLGIGELVTDVEKFMKHKQPLENLLRENVIRHGDITTQAIIVRNQKPYLIDFAEARLWNDPRPNKQSGTDAEWLDKTFMELCKNANSS